MTFYKVGDPRTNNYIKPTSDGSVPIAFETGSVYANTDTPENIATWISGIPDTIEDVNVSYSGTAGSVVAIVITK